MKTHLAKLFISIIALKYRSLCLVTAGVIACIFTCTFQDTFSQVSRLDRTTFKSWKTVKEGNQKYWSVTDSVVTGGDGIQKIPTNTYLHTPEIYGDFEFRCLFRLTGDPETGLINSGIQYRSLIEENEIIGYQADIGDGYWGDIYDEHRRNKLVDGDLSVLKQILNNEGWNSYIIRCQGNKHELYINGVKISEYVEMDAKIPSKGVIGIQLHQGGNAKIEVKHVTITPL